MKTLATYLREESKRIVKMAKKARKKATDPGMKRKYQILEEEFGQLSREL